MARALIVEASGKARGNVSLKSSLLQGFAPGSASDSDSECDASPSEPVRVVDPELSCIHHVLPFSLSSAALSRSSVSITSLSPSVSNRSFSCPPKSPSASLPSSAPVVVTVPAGDSSVQTEVKVKKAKVLLVENPCGVPGCTSHTPGTLDQLYAHLADVHPPDVFERASRPQFLHKNSRNTKADLSNIAILDALTLHDAWNPAKGMNLAVSYNFFHHLSQNPETRDHVPANLSDYTSKRKRIVDNVLSFYTGNGLCNSKKTMTDLEAKVKKVVEERGLLVEVDDADEVVAAGSGASSSLVVAKAQVGGAVAKGGAGAADSVEPPYPTVTDFDVVSAKVDDLWEKVKGLLPRDERVEGACAADAAAPHQFVLRAEFDALSAKIDSLVGSMEKNDALVENVGILTTQVKDLTAMIEELSKASEPARKSPRTSSGPAK